MEKSYKETSFDNLCTAKLLFENEKYPQALWNIQQSIEILCKYIARNDQYITGHPSHLLNGESSIRQIRKTSHNPFHLARLFYYGEEGSKKPDNTEFDEIKDYKPIEKVEILLTILNRFENAKNFRISTKEYEELSKSVLNINKKSINGIIKDKESVERQIRIESAVILAFTLYSITDNWTNETRYPNDKTNQKPQDIFSEGHDYVMNFPMFTYIITTLHKFFDDEFAK